MMKKKTPCLRHHAQKDVVIDEKEESMELATPNIKTGYNDASHILREIGSA